MLCSWLSGLKSDFEGGRLLVWSTALGSPTLCASSRNLGWKADVSEIIYVAVMWRWRKHVDALTRRLDLIAVTLTRSGGDDNART